MIRDERETTYCELRGPFKGLLQMLPLSDSTTDDKPVAVRRSVDPARALDQGPHTVS